MTARKEILERLREQKRVTARPAPWTLHREFEDMAAQFTRALTAVKGQVVRATPDDLIPVLDQILRTHHVTRAVVNGDCPIPTETLFHAFPNVAWGDTVDRAFLTIADVGISGAKAALAETGSVVVDSGPNKSRLATLLPPIHVALVKTSQLVPDLIAYMAARNGDFPANRVLISGPSKTADIEQTLVVGVHGPKQFIVVLVDDGD